jgi:hypothetical protein
VKATKEGVEYVDSYAFCCPVRAWESSCQLFKCVLKSKYFINMFLKN